MSAARKKEEAAFAFHLLLLDEAASWCTAYLARHQRSRDDQDLIDGMRWLRAAKTNLALMERWLPKSKIENPKSKIRTGGAR